MAALLGAADIIAGAAAVSVTVEPLLVPILLVAGVPAILPPGQQFEFAFVASSAPVFRSRA